MVVWVGGLFDHRVDETAPSVFAGLPRKHHADAGLLADTVTDARPADEHTNQRRPPVRRLAWSLVNNTIGARGDADNTKGRDAVSGSCPTRSRVHAGSNSLPTRQISA